MSALTLLIIRHAEKPKEQWPGPGLTIEGVPDKKSLVVRGWQRAGAWAALFGSAPNSGDYPRPVAIYAAQPDADDTGDDPSQRPYETILPLSARLHLTPNTSRAKGEETKLATDLRSLTGVILVSWEHKAIASALLPALLGKQTVPGVPTDWDGARFDVVLRLDRAATDAAWSFRQLFPRLLAGDSDVPLQ